MSGEDFFRCKAFETCPEAKTGCNDLNGFECYNYGFCACCTAQREKDCCQKCEFFESGADSGIEKLFESGVIY